MQQRQRQRSQNAPSVSWCQTPSLCLSLLSRYFASAASRGPSIPPQLNSPAITRPQPSRLMHARSYTCRGQAVLQWPQEQDKCFLVHAHRWTHNFFYLFFFSSGPVRGFIIKHANAVAHVCRRYELSTAAAVHRWQAGTETLTRADCRSCVDANIQDIK